MTNWETKKLGDILQLSNEKSITQNQFPVLTSSRSGLYLQSDYFKKIVASKNNIGYKIIKNGQFTYRAMSDDGYFKFNRLANQKAGIISPAYEVFDVNEGAANAIFIYYLLNSIIISSQIYSTAQGGTRLALRFSTLAKFSVKLPPLNEQMIIAEILYRIDDLIIKKRDLNKKNNLLLKAFIEDLMKGDDTWDRVFLSEILIFKNGLNTSKENFGEGIPFVSYKNVYAGGLINLKDLTECVSLTPSEKDRFCLKRGDILFTRTSETPDEIGFNAVYNTSVPAVFNGFCIRGRPLNDSLLIPEFSSFYFRSNAVLSQMRSLSKYTTRAGISADSLGKVQIMIPPINVQENIANSLSSIKQLIKSVDKSINSLQHLKQSISQDLLSGRKRVNI
tara:strand:- start:143 stop:1315 length:1173 start_codon:yes stop_codon:yes gene_type:complete